MSSTSNMELLLTDPNQIGKVAALNTAIAAIDQGLSGILAVQADDGNHPSPWVVPYVLGDEPASIKTALRFILVTVAGALGADWTAYFPASRKKLFLVQNNTVGGHNVVVKVSSQTGVTVPAGSTILCYLNGVDVIQIPIAAATNSQPYDIGNFVNGLPTAGQVVMGWIAPRTVVFPANFTNNHMKAGVAAAGAAVFKINKNGTQVGTASFTGGGTTPTWASTGGLPITASADDLVEFIAPNPADGSLANLKWTFSGTR